MSSITAESAALEIHEEVMGSQPNEKVSKEQMDFFSEYESYLIKQVAKYWKMPYDCPFIKDSFSLACERILRRWSRWDGKKSQRKSWATRISISSSIDFYRKQVAEHNKALSLYEHSRITKFKICGTSPVRFKGDGSVAVDGRIIVPLETTVPELEYRDLLEEVKNHIGEREAEILEAITEGHAKTEIERKFKLTRKSLNDLLDFIAFYFTHKNKE